MEKGKLTSIYLKKITNGFEVETSYEKVKSEDKWDTLDETFAFATVEEALVKIQEVVKGF